MNKYKYLTTDCFKVGEDVWVTGIQCYPSGRLKYSIRPTLCKITMVEKLYIRIDSGRLVSYRVPSYYYLDSAPDRNSRNSDSLINLNIAKTKEEAIENYNQRIKELIEEKYDSFKILEDRLKQYLL